MAGLIDYKQKYQELKAKFMSSIDAAWNDGFQHGMEASQTDQAQQDSQQADAMAQAQAGAPQPGQPSEQPTEGEAQPGQQAEAPMSQNPNEDELGQHIEKLESMLGKSEISSLELQDLKKTLNDIRSLQVQINLTKSLSSIKNTRLAKSQSFSPKTKANLPAPAQKALSTQQEIVDSIFKKWEGEASKTASDISSILGVEGLTKKE
jgi:hypothetical protein